ncbi:MAG: hypothetical protein ABR887_01370 [Methanoregulaceae archaeon]|jgi:hypothetical protein
MKKHYEFLLLVLVVCFFLITIPVSATDTTAVQSGNDAITRGRPFTISVAGAPNTQYYVWLTGTFTMSGAIGEQPPIIAGGQYNVAQDSPGGPYTIGSYKYTNGNGRTILDDVAPSTSGVPKTSYYALVTTDSSGSGIVEFQTSSNTAAKTFSIRVENSKSYDEESISVVKGSISIEAEVPKTPITPVVTTQLPTPISTTATIPPTPSLPKTTTTKPTPLEIGFCVLAVGVSFLTLRKT